MAKREVADYLKIVELASTSWGGLSISSPLRLEEAGDLLKRALMGG
jgi:hypothetical protein